MFGRTRGRIVAVVATGREDAISALEESCSDLSHLERREALTTGGLYRALEGAHLVLYDSEGLVESGEVTFSQLEEVLSRAASVVVDGASFIADPHRYLDQAKAASGLAEVLPSCSVTFTGLSGGVGKTTCALSLAATFRRRTGLPVAVIEAVHGPSRMLPLVGENGHCPHLYEVVTQDREWPTWQGVTLAPMDGPTARLLSTKDIERAWHDLHSSHILTIIDCPTHHPLNSIAVNMTDQTYVVTDGRPDALAAAVFLREQEGYDVLLNRSTLPSRLALGDGVTATVPDVGRAAARFPDRLGQPLMRLIYPGWRN